MMVERNIILFNLSIYQNAEIAKSFKFQLVAVKNTNSQAALNGHFIINHKLVLELFSILIV